MRGQRGIVRHVAVFMLVLGLLAGSVSLTAAEDLDESESSSAETDPTANGDATGNGDDTELQRNDEGEGETTAGILADTDPMAEVTFSVTSAGLDVLPGDTTWAISGEADNGKTVDFGESIDQGTALPLQFVASDAVPYGTFTMTFDVSGGVEFVSTSIVVDEPVVTVPIELVPIADSQVTLNLLSADPDNAGQLPETASWTIVSNSGGGVVAEGEFTEDQRSLPSSVALAEGIPYDEYLVTIAANWAFEPYERLHVIDQPIQELDIVLEPYTPVAVPVSVTVSLPDGADGDIDFRWALDNDETLANIDSGSGTYSLPTTLWEGELLPGDYWVSIYPEGNYLAVSSMFTVLPNTPAETFNYEIVPLGPEPTAEATQTPTEAAVTPTAEPDTTDEDKDDKAETKVTTLPSTGQGSDTTTGTSGALLLGMVSLLLMGTGAIWRLRRIGA